MGYRSKVVLAVLAEELVNAKLSSPELSAALEDANVTPGYWSSATVDEDAECEIIPGIYVAPRIPDYYVLQWSAVKWYSSYTDVALIDAWMVRMDDAEDDRYSFLRMGEELDDLEHRGSWEFDLYVDIHHHAY